MKIFAAGIATETNTFSPVPTRLEDFNIQRGIDAKQGRIEHPSLDLSHPWGAQASARGDEFVFGIMAWAQPSGTTVRTAYETLRAELLQGLRAALPVDIVLLNLHGAMVAEGYDDCEQDLIRRIRELVGLSAVIAAVLDLHCHLSDAKIAAADLIITYKEYPHVDVNDRARQLFDLAVKSKLGEIVPSMALFDCRMIGLYPTTRAPLRGFVDEMYQAELELGVLSLSFGHGFQFADIPHGGAKVLAITDNNPASAQRLARRFGELVYAMRREIGFDAIALPLETALTRAATSLHRPVVVADQSDNPGGGAAGDSTFALHWLLAHDVSDAGIAIIYDPEVVEVAVAAGVGATLSVRLGGKMGSLSGLPVVLDVRVGAIRKNYHHAFPQQSGFPWVFPAGDVVALSCGTLDLIVSSERCQCFSPSIFSDLGVDPARKRVLIVKSVQHFYGAFAPMAGDIIYMAAAGAVNPDPRQLDYHRFDTTRAYPWSDNPLGASA